jgi:hypothetical protein
LPDVSPSEAEIRMTTGYVELLTRPLKAFPTENFYLIIQLMALLKCIIDVVVLLH